MGGRIHFDLARDVLDKQLSDVNELPFGKVDGILIELREGQPPRLVALEVGGMTAVHRLPKLMRRILEPLARKWAANHGAPMLVPWENVVGISMDIDVDIDASDTQALYWERQLRRIVSRIPGAE